MSPPTQFGFAASMSGGRQDDAADRRRLEVLDVPADPLDDPVGVRLAQLLGPAAVAVSSSPAASPFGRGGSSCSWTQSTHEPSGAREGSTAIGCPSAIVASAGSRPRSASLTARETPSRPGVRWSERRAREPLVATPARQLVHRDVDLHLAAAVAEARSAASRTRGGASPVAEQPAVELRRRDAGEHGARGAGSSRRRRAGRRSRGRRRRGSARPRPRCAARRPPRARSSARPSTSLTPPPFGTGIPPSWSAQAITCVMKPDIAWSGPRPGVQHPRREQAARLLARRTSPSASRAPRAASGRRTRRGRGGRSASRPCGRARALRPTRARCRARRTRCPRRP